MALGKSLYVDCQYAEHDTFLIHLPLEVVANILNAQCFNSGYGLNN